MLFIKFVNKEGTVDYNHWSYFVNNGLEYLPQVHDKIIDAIEQGEYYEEEVVNNYVHTHYRIYNHSDGTLVVDAVCINEYGSCYGLGYGYIHKDTKGIEFNFDYFDLEV